MAGYVYRGSQPISSDGLDHGTRAGLIGHARLGTPACDACSSVQATPVTVGNGCANGHENEIDPVGRCRACRREYEAVLMRCTGCGEAMTRSSLTRHRARHASTCRGTAAMPLTHAGQS